MSSQGMTVVGCHVCGQGNYYFELNCKGCAAELYTWKYLPPEEIKRYTCWKCGGRYTLVSENPDNGAGCIIMALGILFVPVLIGIFLIIIGAQMSSATKSHWQCRSCGLMLPA